MNWKKISVYAVVALFLISGIGYYFAGLQVYKSATGTNIECNSHKENLPTEFTINGYGTKISEVGAENMSETAQNLSQFYFDGYENVSIDLEEEDIMISTWIKETNSSRPWVILVHGIRSCKANHEVLLPAGMLVKADFNVVLMDMRDHWKSTIEDNQVSAGQKEWRDMVGVHDYLVNERGVDAEKIGIFGASMGAGTSGIAFSEHGIQAAWLDSPFSNMGDIISEELENLGYPAFLKQAGIIAGIINSGENLVKYDPIDAVENIEGKSIYVVHGAQDSRIQVHHGEEFCNALNQSSGAENTGCWIEDSSITFPRGGDGEDFNLNHITLMLTHTDEYEQRMVGFFEASLA